LSDQRRNNERGLGEGLHVPADQNRGFKGETNLNGEEFVFKNDADRILFRTRMNAALLSLLLAPLVFAMAREMFGTAAVFLALALLAFDPNILAHGALVTTDEYGILVFDGSVDIPRVAALNHAARAWQLGGEKHPEEACGSASSGEAGATDRHDACVPGRCALGCESTG
jgi:hypothetical protein